MVLETTKPRDKNSRTIQEAPALKVKVYSDATYTYICRAVPGTALATAEWQIVRIDADGSKQFTDTKEFFKKAATSLVVVAAYTYE